MPNSENLQSQLKQVTRHIKNNQLNEAQSLIRELIERHPNNADVWYLASHASKNPEQQIKSLQRALRLKPDHSQAKARLAKLSHQTKTATAELHASATRASAKPKQPIPLKTQRRDTRYYWMGALVLVSVIGIGLIIALSTRRAEPTTVASSGLTQLVTNTVEEKPTMPTRSAFRDATEPAKDIRTLPPLILDSSESARLITDVGTLPEASSPIADSRPSTQPVTETQTLSPTLSPATASSASAQFAADTPEGERIVFFDGDTMYLIKPDGSEQTFVHQNSDFNFQNTDINLRQFRWSPETHQFLFTTPGKDSTLVLDPFTGSRFLLGPSRHASWSPDGTQAVVAWSRTYVRGESYLTIVNANGSNALPITSTRKYSYNPEWSPDGRLIAFVRSEDDHEVIYTIKPDGSDETRVTNGANPKWSPDSQTLLFYREEGPIGRTLYRIRPNGSDEIKIAPIVGTYQDEVAYKWSPDGNKIALLVPQSGGEPDKLFVTTPDGRKILWEYNLAIPTRIMNYVWSPDSTRLLVLNEGNFIVIDITTGVSQLLIAQRNEPNSLYGSLGFGFAWLTEEQTAESLQALQIAQTIREQQMPPQLYYFLDSLSPVSLAQFDGQTVEHIQSSVSGSEIQQNSGFSSWSPDGTQIVFDSINYPARTWSLYTMDVDGSNVQQIAPLGFRPVWSPNGRRIGFLSYIEEIGENSFNPDDKVGYLYVMDPDGQNIIQISDQPVSDWVWSPDGYSIAYTSDGNVTVVRADGKNPQIVAEDGFAPTWSPNSLYIAFAGTEEADRCICFVPADGSTPPIPIGQGHDPAWSPDGMQIAFLQDDGLYVMIADGSDVRLVTSSQAEKYAPLWSPDGTYIGYWEDRLSENFNTGPYIFRLIHPDGTGLQTIPVPASFEEYLPPYRMQWVPEAIHNHVEDFVQQQAAPDSVPTVAPLATIRLLPTLTLTPTPIPPGFKTPVPTPIGGPDLGGGNGKIFFYEGSAGSGEYYEFDLTARTKTSVSLPSYVYNIIPHPNGLFFVARDQHQSKLRPILINKTDLTISPISNIEVSTDIALSPDGSQIAYGTIDPSTQLGEIFIANLDGTNIRRITNTGVIEVDDPSTQWWPGDPAWSPDGQRIGYSYAGKLRVVDLATLKDEVLVEAGHRLVWSPDGQHIAYFISGGRGLSISIYDEPDPLAPNIFIANVDGSNAYSIGNGRYESLAWSPDGEHLVLSQNGNIFTINRDGTELALMLERSDQYVGNLVWEAPLDAFQPSISPLLISPTPTPGPSPTLSFGGGTGKIVFKDGIVLQELDLQNLTSTYTQLPSSDIGKVVFHPDPRYLVVVYKGKPAIITRADGTIFPIPNISEGHNIVVSLDGSQIAYAVGGSDAPSHQLWIASINGENPQVIADSAPMIYHTAWSPDGTRIAYNSGMQVRVINLQTLESQVVVEGGIAAAWSPDSQQISYVAFQDNQKTALSIVNADGSNPHPVITGKVRDTPAAWSPDGSQLVFSQDDGIYIVYTDGSHLTRIHARYASGLIWQALPDPNASYATLAPLMTLTPSVTPTVPTATSTPALSFGGGTGKIVFSQGENSVTVSELDLSLRDTTFIALVREVVQVELHPDGQHFVGTYAEGVNGRAHGILKPVLINKDDLKFSFIPNIERGFNVSVSPDGSQIAYIGEDTNTQIQRVWVANLDGSNAHPISDPNVQLSYVIDNLWTYYPDWSPDGTRIAYSDGTQVRVIDLNTLTDQVVVEAGTGPDWSPDGESIAYVADGIAIVKRDGTKARLLMRGGSDPSWSPDGSQLIFNQRGDIYLIRTDGSGLTLVQTTMGSDPGNFKWEALADPSLSTPTPFTLAPTPTLASGGGSGKIFYNKGPEYQVWLVELDLGTLTQNNLPLPDSIIQVIPHPDGQYFVGTYQYIRERHIKKPVLIHRTDLTILPIPNVDQGYDVALSPDGSQIAYVVDDPVTREGQIWAATLDGTNIRQISDPLLKALPTNSLPPVSDPTWSSDGTRIAYTANRQVRVIDLRTSSDQVVIESGYSPAWSPDGQQIAYVVQAEESAHLYIANADGTDPRPMITDKTWVSDPEWSPDGSYLIFTRPEGIYIAPLDGREATRVMVEGAAGAFGFTWDMLIDPAQPTLTPRSPLPVLTTFTPTPTFTPSATATPWHIFTPTPAVTKPGPTPTPAVFEMPSQNRGRAFVQMTSSHTDAILFGGSTLTPQGLSLEGFAELRRDHSTISISLRPGQNASGAPWEFYFYAPQLEIGPTYRTDAGPVFNEASMPRVFIRTSSVDISACSSAVGEFRIEAVEPHLVVSFTHACNGAPAQEVRGLIVFKPDE